MATGAPPLLPRWGRLPTVAIWLAWGVVAGFLCVPPLLWHLQYLKAGSPSLFVPYVASLVLSVAVFPTLWHIVRRRGLRRWEPAAFAAFCLAAGLLYEPRGTLVGLWMLAAAYATGSFLLTRFDLHFASPTGSIAVAAGSGFAVFTIVLFFLGLAGGFRSWLLAALLALPCVALRRHVAALAGKMRQLHRHWGDSTELESPLASLMVAVAGVLTVCAVIVALAPSIAFDPLKVHLPLAQHYVEQGDLVPIKSESYSYYPQGFESLLAVSYSFGGQPAAQIAPVLFFVLALLATFAIVRECGFTRLAAFVGVVLVSAVPFLHWTGANVKNDAAVACYHLAGLLAFLRWRTTGNFRFVILTVFLAAASSGVKLTAIFGIATFGVLCLYAVWKQPRRVAVLAATFAAFGLLWQLRTWALTGNPVYPRRLTDSVEVSLMRSDIPEQQEVTSYLAWPWQVHFAGWKPFHSFTPTPLGVALVVFLPAWILLRRRPGSKRERICWIFVGIYILYWSQFWLVLRYAAAPIAIVFALLGARLTTLCMAPSKWSRAAALGATGFCLFFSLAVTFILEIHAPHFRLFTRQIDRADYLREVLPAYPPVEFLHQIVEPGDLVFGIGNCARAYAPDPGRFGCVLEPFAVESQLRRFPYRYVIMPVNAEARPLWRRVYQDAHFRVFETQSQD